jgi:hypothetical protein
MMFPEGLIWFAVTNDHKTTWFGSALNREDAKRKASRHLIGNRDEFIAIPYAFSVIIKGKLHRICPTCDEAIAEGTNKSGEQTTNNYAKHYEDKHA